MRISSSEAMQEFLLTGATGGVDVWETDKSITLKLIRNKKWECQVKCRVVARQSPVGRLTIRGDKMSAVLDLV